MDNDNFWKMRDVVARRQQADGETRRTADKARLARTVEKKLKTSFVGAIARVEEKFGRLWGHGLPAADCTDAQLRARPLWEALRNDILTNGNNQLRAVLAELEQYSVEWKRHQIVFRVKDQEI